MSIAESVAFSYSEEMDDALAEVRNATTHAKFDTNTLSIVGEEVDEMPYDVLIRQVGDLAGALEKEVRHLQFLRVHDHDWDERDVCIHCGADGRA